MPERMLQLTLNRHQRFAFFTHIMMYLFDLTHHPSEPRPKELIETLQEVAYQLRLLRENEPESLEVAFLPEAVEAIKKMMAILQPLYEQWEQRETYSVALQDLTACRKLIEEAEQRTNTRTESRGKVDD